MTDKFGFEAAKDPKRRDNPPPDDLSDFMPAKPHTPDRDTEAQMDQRAADMGFTPRNASDHDAADSLKRARARRRPPPEPATQLTLHIPERVAERFINWSTDNKFRSYWSALEWLMDQANVPK